MRGARQGTPLLGKTTPTTSSLPNLPPDYEVNTIKRKPSFRSGCIHTWPVHANGSDGHGLMNTADERERG
jgi:hypothetical protein